jgi:hypothetical protein
MKYIFVAIAFIYVVTPTQAQDCQSAYSPMLEDTKIETTNYNKKGKISNVVKTHIYEVQSKGDTTLAKVQAQMLDDEGEEVFKNQYEIKCAKGVILVDMRTFLGEMAKQFEKMEAKVEGNFIEYPDNMTPGTSLPDAEMVIDISSDSPISIKVRMNMTDRKVEAMEKITTPAGTFDCVKVSYTIETKMGFNRSTRSAIWMAKGIGTVKMESYDKKGNVDFWSEMTKFEK